MKGFVCSVLFAATAFGSYAVAQERAYPNKQIMLVVPFPAGSPTDAAARIAAKVLSDELGQPVVVDYKSGASGTIASRYVARAPADGYTLLATSSSTHVAAPAVMTDLPYDAEADFTAISPVARADIVVVGRQNLPAADLQELIATIRKNPGKLTYASSGEGTVLHLSGALFEAGVGGKLVHVPYRGAAPATVDLMGGQVDLMFDTVSNATQNVRNGRLKAYAVLAPVRSEALPDVPSVVELGMPELAVPTVWLGLMGPSGMPTQVVQTLTDALKKGVAEPEIAARIGSAGMQSDVLDSAAFTQRNKEARQVYSDLAKRSGLELSSR